MSKDISMSPIVLVIGGNHERAHKSVPLKREHFGARVEVSPNALGDVRSVACVAEARVVRFGT